MCREVIKREPAPTSLQLDALRWKTLPPFQYLKFLHGHWLNLFPIQFLTTFPSPGFTSTCPVTLVSAPKDATRPLHSRSGLQGYFGQAWPLCEISNSWHRGIIPPFPIKNRENTSGPPEGSDLQYQVLILASDVLDHIYSRMGPFPIYSNSVSVTWIQYAGPIL